jgi:23S rRNA pseudouridine1911/1915/1917 synthase
MKLQAASEDRGLRLDLFLLRHLESITRSQIQVLNRRGAIYIDGRQEKAGYKVRGTETVEVDLHVLELDSLKPEQIPIQIHFEDEDLAVIEKPAGMVVHPGAGTKGGTMVHALLFHFQNLSDAGGESRPGIVHRLDKWTSGLMIVAKNNQTHAKLGKAFQDRLIQKTYLTLVHGKPPKDTGTIELTIGRHPRIRTRMVAAAGGGRSAHSEYRVIDRLREFSLLEVKIKTGRTHQIRVHLSAIGCPVVGDDVYGEPAYRQFIQKYGAFNRYFLHSAFLKFNHPSSGLPLEFRSPLPPDLQRLLDRLTPCSIK